MPRGRRPKSSARLPYCPSYTITQDTTSAKLFVDETKAPVPDPGRGQTIKLATSARSPATTTRGGSSDPPAVVCRYAPGWGSLHALALLKDSRGILQTDGYVAYKKVAR